MWSILKKHHKMQASKFSLDTEACSSYTHHVTRAPLPGQNLWISAALYVNTYDLCALDGIVVLEHWHLYLNCMLHLGLVWPLFSHFHSMLWVVVTVSICAWQSWCRLRIQLHPRCGADVAMTVHISITTLIKIAIPKLNNVPVRMGLLEPFCVCLTRAFGCGWGTHLPVKILCVHLDSWRFCIFVVSASQCILCWS